MIKNAIILAGGEGTRLLPFTSYVSKQLLGVAGKPLIDYPINTLKQMGVENLTIVVGSSFSGQILDYIKDGSKFGLKVNYIYQSKPEGIAQAINLCKRFVADENEFAVILGDNWFQNPVHWNNIDGAQLQLIHNHPELKRFGVAVFDKLNPTLGIVKIEEKPQLIDSRYDYYVISGCYLFDHLYFDYFKNLTKSLRGEYEIVDIIKQYYKDDKLSCVIYNYGWVDAGTHEAINYLNKKL